MKNKVVILGAATGYSPDKVKVFVESLQSVGFSGKLVLFLNPHQIADYELFFNQPYKFEIQYEVSNIGLFLANKKIHNELKKIIKKASRLMVWANKSLKEKFIYYFSFPHVSRFFDYKNFIAKEQGISHVILTDTRDVIFQKNPDDLFEKQALYLGMEDKNNPIGQDSFHIKWISDVYGKDYLATIAEQPICCAGVTLGDKESIQDYLKVMVDEFLKLPYYTMIKSNYDQGIHNKLLYTQSFKNTHLCAPLNSILATLGTIPRENIQLNEKAEILNSDGSVAAIVHQYDRHADINTLVEDKYL